MQISYTHKRHQARSNWELRGHDEDKPVTKHDIDNSNGDQDVSLIRTERQISTSYEEKEAEAEGKGKCNVG